MTNDIDSAARRVAIQETFLRAFADVATWQHEDRAAQLVRFSQDAVDALTRTDASEVERREDVRFAVQRAAAVALAWLEQIAIEEQQR